MTTLKPGNRVTIVAVVESEGHDDQHVIVRIGGTPVQVPASSLLSAEKAPRSNTAGRRYAAATLRMTRGTRILTGWTAEHA